MANVSSNSSNQTDAWIPDPDVAGPGVLVGFIMTGTITFFASSLIVRFRDIPAFDGKPRKIQDAIIRLCTPSSVKDARAFWIDLLEKLVLGLAMQQLVLGPVLIIIAFIKYIPDQDWDNLDIALDTANFSAVTHLSTLWALRSFLRNHMRWTIFKLFIIAITPILIISGRIIGKNAALLVQAMFLPGLYFLGIVLLYSTDLILEILHSMNWRKMEEYKSSAEFAAYLSRLQSELSSPTSILERLTQHSFYKVCVLFRSSSKKDGYYKAMLFHIWSPFLSWLLQFANFVMAIQDLGIDMQASRISGDWSFGQFLAVFQVFLPILSLAESWSDVVKDHATRHRTSTSQASLTGRQSPQPTSNNVNASTMSRTSTDAAQSGIDGEDSQVTSSGETAGSIPLTDLSLHRFATAPPDISTQNRASTAVDLSDDESPQPIRRASTLRHVV